MNIAAVIHQPRYEIFTMFHDVLLLGKGGRTVYLGPTEEAEAYFASLGFVCPPHVNPADFFLDVISSEAPRTDGTFTNSAELASLWATSHPPGEFLASRRSSEQAMLPDGLEPEDALEVENQPLVATGRPGELRSYSSSSSVPMPSAHVEFPEDSVSLESEVTLRTLWLFLIQMVGTADEYFSSRFDSTAQAIHRSSDPDQALGLPSYQATSTTDGETCININHTDGESTASPSSTVVVAAAPTANAFPIPAYFWGWFVLSFLIPISPPFVLSFGPQSFHRSYGTLFALLSVFLLVTIYPLFSTLGMLGTYLFGYLIWILIPFVIEVLLMLALVRRFMRGLDVPLSPYFVNSMFGSFFYIYAAWWSKNITVPKRLAMCFGAIANTYMICLILAMTLGLGTSDRHSFAPLALSAGLPFITLMMGNFLLFWRLHQLPSLRILPPFWVKLWAFTKRAFVQMLRAWPGIVFDFAMAVFAGTFVGIIYYNRYYIPPPISNFPGGVCPEALPPTVCKVLSFPQADPCTLHRTVITPLTYSRYLTAALIQRSEWLQSLALPWPSLPSPLRCASLVTRRSRFVVSSSPA